MNLLWTENRVSICFCIILSCAAFGTSASLAQHDLPPDKLNELREKQKEVMKQQKNSLGNQMLLQQLQVLQHNPSLQEQLEITEAQIEEIRPIMQAFQEGQQEMMQFQIERQKRMRKLQEEQDTDGLVEIQKEMMDFMQKLSTEPMERIKEVFLPHQIERMQQLGRQQAARMRSGNDDFGIALALADELGLDRDQRRELQQEVDKQRSLYEEETAKLKKGALDSIMETLTHEQRDELKKLVGPLYDPMAEMMRANRERIKKHRQSKEKDREEDQGSDRPDRNIN